MTMKQNLLLLWFTMPLYMISLNITAHDIAIKNNNGVTIYYNFNNNNTELAVTFRGLDYENSEGYSGVVAIPNRVTYKNKILKVTSVGRFAFYGCTNLTSVTIPHGVTYIYESAFSRCPRLISLTIPNTVTEIGNYAFSHCSSLTSVAIPNGVTKIEMCAFNSCTSLTSVTIPNGVTEIEMFTFGGCKNLTSVTIGSGVKEIATFAFSDCPKLTDVFCYAENVPNTNSDAFYKSKTENVTLHVPATSIKAYMSIVPWSSFKNIVRLVKETPPIKEQSGIVRFNGPIQMRINDHFTTEIEKIPLGNFLKFNDDCMLSFSAQLSGNQKSATLSIKKANNLLVDKMEWKGDVQLVETIEGRMFVLMCNGEECVTLIKNGNKWIIFVPKTEEHLSFKGVPIDGKIDNVVILLEKMGYTKDDVYGNVVVMQGLYEGERVEIYVFSTPISRIAYQIVVCYPETHSWQLLKSRYSNTVKQFVQRYGIPSDHSELFLSPFYEGDGYEIEAVKDEKCKYASYFKAKNGYVDIRISKLCHVNITFIDDKNADIYKQEKE